MKQGKDEILSHSCAKFKLAKCASYGIAVDSIEYWEDRKEWWMDNGEYATGPIFYCPFCGELLKRP